MTPHQIESQHPRWRYYFRALHLKQYGGWDHEDSPWPGFYRYPVHKGGQMIGVAIFDPPGNEKAVVCLKGYPPIAWEAFMIWDKCYRNPITEAQYRAYEASGQWWDDLKAGVRDVQEGRQTVRDLAKAAPLLPLPKAGRFA